MLEHENIILDHIHIPYKLVDFKLEMTQDEMTLVYETWQCSIEGCDYHEYRFIGRPGNSDENIILDHSHNIYKLKFKLNMDEGGLIYETWQCNIGICDYHEYRFIKILTEQ